MWLRVKGRMSTATTHVVPSTHVRVAMADAIKTFKYSKTGGRGRGILSLTNFEPSRRPGERSDNLSTTSTRNATVDRTQDERLAPSGNERTDSGGVCTRYV